jgi:predicted negative regulator of RcsB-dependent stress response
LVDDFYSEQEQWERVKLWLRENGPWLVAGVLIGALALAGWRWWEQRVERLAQEASAQYAQALDAFSRGDRTRGLTLIDELRRDHASSPYADQGDLAAARVLVESNDLPKAVERLTTVVNGSKDQELRLVARLRLARVQLAQGNPDTAIATLAAAQSGAFAPRFDEVRADALLAKGDKVAALRAYRAARQADTQGVLDTAAIDLKIADLVADGVAEAPAAAPAVPAAPGASPAPAGSTP